MTKISNQIVYIPDLEINGLDYFIGTDYDQNKRTVNFRVEDLGSHYNITNGVRNFEYIFYEHTNISPTPTDGYFYSNDNETDPNNIDYFIFSKKTARNKDVTQFFQSIISGNPFDLIVAQKTGINTIFFFRINEIIENANFFRLNVSEVFFPENNSLERNYSHAVFNLKASGPGGATKHSELDLDDGTNPHGTTKSDVGLGNVDNTSDLDKPISDATQSALDLKADITYVDGLVVGLLDDRGSYDASTNLFPSTGGSGAGGIILKGDLWFVSVEGVLGGIQVNIGDSFRALIDTPGQTASNWSVLEGNLGYVPENISNKQDSLAIDGTGTKYATVDAVNSGLNSKQETLVSGTNIKTINGNSLVGSGDLSIQTINTVKTITSSSLSTQDITGFLTYLNAVTSFSIGLNETVDYHVTDTNQYFKILVNGVSVGSGQTAILESQVITYDLNTMAKFKGALYLWQPIGNQISVVGAVTPTTVGTGSNATSNFSGTYTSSPALTWNRRRSVSAASAGSTAEFYEAGWHVCSVGLGFYFVAQVQSELNPSNARLFDGLTNSLTAFPNSDPSSQINLLGFGKDASDTNYHIIHNDGTGTATKVLLTGSNFLASNLDSFRIEIINLYNSNTVTFIITNLRTRGVSLVNVNSDLPSITTGLAPRLSSNNGATAASVTKSWNKLEIRTNN